MYLDEFKQQLPDIDERETSDWIESLDDVLDQEGETRARFLLFKLLKRARQRQVGLPPLTNTRYINTISPEQEPFFPGDEQLERRIRRLIRWNAVAMVLRANNRFAGIGGHLATYASAATLYEVGFNHFFRGKDGDGAGDQIFYQGHAAPGIYARAFLEGRLSEDQLDHFRRETPPQQGLSSYPHPRLMPDFWEFPTVSMGLGPISAIYQARFNRYLENRGLLDTSRSRVWAFLGDGETDEPEAPRRGPRGPRQPDVRRQLQPPAPRWPGPRQRQDHPGARGGLPGLRLERDQGHLGPRMGRAPRPRRRRRPGREDEHDGRRRVPEVLGRGWGLRSRALLRA
jgi:pyruvate dehydrogenase E1 component